MYEYYCTFRRRHSLNPWNAFIIVQQNSELTVSLKDM